MKKSKECCSGCHDDMYNHEPWKGCWSFKRMRIKLRKKVHMNQVPPWKQEPVKLPDCFHQDRFVFVGPKQEC